MLTEQDIFNIAEWIVYNAETLYSKMMQFDDETDPETFLYNEAVYHFGKQFTLEDLNIAFDDEKLLTIIDLYFKRERYEKDSLH